MNRSTAEKAARWWSDQLRGTVKLDNGDDSEVGKRDAIKAAILQDIEVSQRSSEDADKFEFAMINILLFTLDDHLYFGCDHNPDCFLRTIAKIAGINLSRVSLPWKTTMRIDGDVVCVRSGYRAETITL